MTTVKILATEKITTSEIFNPLPNQTQGHLMTLPVADPRHNAGISLTSAEKEKLDKFCMAANLNSRSAVVSLLIEKGLPKLWMSLELES